MFRAQFTWIGPALDINLSENLVLAQLRGHYDEENWKFTWWKRQSIWNVSFCKISNKTLLYTHNFPWWNVWWDQQISGTSEWHELKLRDGQRYYLILGRRFRFSWTADQNCSFWLVVPLTKNINVVLKGFFIDKLSTRSAPLKKCFFMAISYHV